MRYQLTKVCIDDTTIKSGNPWDVIAPVWKSVDISHGSKAYESSLRRFTKSQRYVVALQWFIAEVCNGGLRQFYSNPTGVVWQDALDGCKAMGLNHLGEIILQSAKLLGGSPSKIRSERIHQLSRHAPNFKDLDDLFFKALSIEGVDDYVMKFIRANAADFYFEGHVDMPVDPDDL